MVGPSFLVGQIFLQGIKKIKESNGTFLNSPFLQTDTREIWLGDTILDTEICSTLFMGSKTEE